MKKLLTTISFILVFVTTSFTQNAIYKPYSPNFEGNVANFYIDGTNIVDYITSGAVQISSQYLPLDGGTISNNLIIMGSLIVSNADNKTHLAIGKDAVVNYDGLFAGGDYAWASSNNAIALGYYVYGTNSDSFIWQGNTSGYIYGTHGNGTFNVNPANGPEGFYVGETNLHDIITNEIDLVAAYLVKKTGDTMTGDLTVPALNTTSIRSTKLENGSSAVHADGEYAFATGSGSSRGPVGNTYIIKVSGEADTTTYTINSYYSQESLDAVEPGSIISYTTNRSKVISVNALDTDPITYTLTVDKTLGALNNASLVLRSGNAYGNNSTVEGFANIASGENSRASGTGNIASGNDSIAEGKRSRATNDNSYVWNQSTTKYGSHGNGTFNINPVNGINSFYIGTNTLGDYIDARIQAAFANAAGNNGVLNDPTPANRINDPTSW